jgi:hypothetical protein
LEKNTRATAEGLTSRELAGRKAYGCIWLVFSYLLRAKLFTWDNVAQEDLKSLVVGILIFDLDPKITRAAASNFKYLWLDFHFRN